MNFYSLGYLNKIKFNDFNNYVYVPLNKKELILDKLKFLITLIKILRKTKWQSL